jgi:excisionase family DNA binding protein
MVTSVGAPAETDRKADRRLRELLFGDGVSTTGLVRGEEFRLQVTGVLRHMRNAFDAALLESEAGRDETAVARVADMEEELQRIASFRSRAQQVWPDGEIPSLVTPAEAAQALRMSVSSIYRAIREGEIRAARLTEAKRGALRIPKGELERLLEGARR